ncbi:EAL domain-containing protein, partial [Microcoleus sp. HI-ES]|nr:EAL domain-containing protein [Microcoleus sp. HI-ES]
IHISLDDFGTGYSSLWSLKNFPLNNLKIDKSFVADLVTGSSGATIVKLAIALGQGLNLQVIAEGVETEAELDFLKQHQCDIMQGYLFSRPEPAAIIESMLVADPGLFA